MKVPSSENPNVYEAAIFLATSTQSSHEEGRGSRLGHSLCALL